MIEFNSSSSHASKRYYCLIVITHEDTEAHVANNYTERYLSTGMLDSNAHAFSYFIQLLLVYQCSFLRSVRF